MHGIQLRAIGCFLKHADSFKGTFGTIKHFLNVGIENGTRYSLSGNFVGIAPISGVAIGYRVWKRFKGG